MIIRLCILQTGLKKLHARDIIEVEQPMFDDEENKLEPEPEEEDFIHTIPLQDRASKNTELLFFGYNAF